MKKRESFAPVFIFFLLFSMIIFGFSRTEIFNGLYGAIGSIFSPFQKITYQSAQSLLSLKRGENLKRLEEENTDLTRQLAAQKTLEKENKALRDQFETQIPKSTDLLPARIIGAPNFIPGVSEPSVFILDKGEKDGVRLYSAVVYEDNLVGNIAEVNQFRSRVNLITNTAFSFVAKTLRTDAAGVIAGEGGRKMILQNIMQTADIKEEDLVLTKGEQDIKGKGFPPDLIVGEVISVDKKPSALFQKANVVSRLDFASLSTVFIVKSD